jgi:hypothetical protein
MALLVEGLEVGSDTAIEEYVIEPPDAFPEEAAQDDTEKIKLFGPGAGFVVARPVKGQSMLGSALSLVSHQGTVPLMDPIVPLFASVHEKVPEMLGSMRSTLFPNFGSMFSMADQQPRPDNWDEESQREGEGEGEDYTSDNVGGDSDDNLESPLLSRQATSMEGKEISLAQGNSSLFQVGPNGEAVSGMGIGGGWLLAWKWSEADGEFKRMYLHPEEGAGGTGSVKGSFVSVPGGEMPEELVGCVQAAALVSQSALFSKDMMGQNPVGPAMVHPAETAVKGPKWQSILEPGVTRALIIGIGIQILQQVY